ncbi:aminotransferase class V-fold PLP-dependent enzyme [Butyrivibrio sp. VCD2006]|uniref:aminotransferase class V-fold PLP-dependent enzyme n=1 Tax=Butyrivibrio sp. VCD2006 TaxID=1280664 RepID=UPI00042A68A0|nr:aminotransferase class V-fold PLP-dependent enzyme [Butyrivibrio sp. VCD2006]
MIYFDNAATTREKPKEVLDAFVYYVTQIGVSPGRGSYSLGIEASRMLYKSRVTVAEYFGINEPNVIFTKNSTEAINLFFRGFLNKGDHVVISPYEHNAVLRPLEMMRKEGLIDYSVIERDDLSESNEFILDKYTRENTKVIALTLASNLTGRIIFRSSLFNAARQRGIKTFVDASQGAGKIKLNMFADGIDYLAFTGHKDLKALPGVGGLCSRETLDFNPLIQGGTGVHGHEKTNPHIFPEGYESGTLNMPAIWALKTAIEIVSKDFQERSVRTKALTEELMSQLLSLENVTVYDKDFERVDTIGFNIDGYSSNEMVGILDKNNICTRGGIHCAILAHEALGTVDKGVVRVSLSEKNTEEEIQELIGVIKSLGEK